VKEMNRPINECKKMENFFSALRQEKMKMKEGIGTENFKYFQLKY
jgi:hypothetical protein